jgi:pimeloyl-ACP methyl ester carboxylesterase
VRTDRGHDRQGLNVLSSHDVTVVVHELPTATTPSPPTPPVGVGGRTGPEPLLLVHATGFHGYVWEPLAAHLEGFRAFAPDLRGHGDASAPSDGDFSWNGFADDVLAVVDHLGASDLAAVGHSKGGAALLLAEQRRPGTFRSLYLYEPVVIPPDAASENSGANPLAEGALRRRPAFASRDEAFENFSAKPPFSALDPAALRAYVDHGFRDEPDGSVRLKCEPEHESQVYRMGPRHDAFEHLHAVACPVTVARGGFSDFGPAAFAEPIAEALPEGRLEVFEHLGHFGPLEQPGEVAGAVQRFLRE